ncbi:SUMF1/EgtB/PvdO family nonheme iron enzyme [bacterium]|nr:SUMF1/EgtB/PvdO family nonheme iron enzyme [bacterium]
MRCFKCGAEVSDNLEKCSVCGQSFRNKKDVSKNLYSKIQELSKHNAIKEFPLGISIGDILSEQYSITDFVGESVIFYTFTAVDRYNKQKVSIDFLKPSIVENDSEYSRFVNALREEKFRQHENLALIYDYGRYKNIPFIVSEYLDGVSLSKIIQMKQNSNENFSLDEVEPIIAQITDALQEIHEDSLNGYLIPENIIILSDVLKIKNYFWFRCFRSEAVLRYFTSESNSFYFLAPELRGGSQKLTNATDLYSLGVLVSSLLTGKIHKGVPYTLTEYNSSLQDELDSIFFKLTNKNSNKRYQNIDEFLIDFDALFEIPMIEDDKTRVVNTNELVFDDGESYEFEDELETSLVERKKREEAKLINSFESTNNLSEQQINSNQEKLTNIKKVLKPEEKDNSIIKEFFDKKTENSLESENSSDKKLYNPLSKQEEPNTDEIETAMVQPQPEKENLLPEKKEEEKNIPPKIERVDVNKNTSPDAQNPFYRPDQFASEQANYSSSFIYKQQQMANGNPEYSNNMYQQPVSMYQPMPYPPYQQKSDSSKNLLIIIGFIILTVALATSIIIIFINNNKENQINPYITNKINAEQNLKEFQKEREELEKQRKELDELKKQLITQKSNAEVMEFDGSETEKQEMIKKEEAKLAQLKEKEVELEKKRKEVEQKAAEELKKKEIAEKEIKEKNLSAQLKKEEDKRALETSKKTTVAKNETKKDTTSKIVSPKEEKKEDIKIASSTQNSKKDNSKRDMDAEADALLAMVSKEIDKKDSTDIKTDTKKEEKIAPNPDGNCPSDMVKIKEGVFPYGTPANDPFKSALEPALKSISIGTYCIDRYESSVSVNYKQAEANCNKKGKRICTSQEWEKACKGPAGKKYPYGDSFDPERCNTADANGESRTATGTGKFKKCRSPYGIFDMSGNYAEWVSGGDGSTQFVKGGSFSSEDYDARCASVKKRNVTSKDSTTGYRCCKDPE